MVTYGMNKGDHLNEDRLPVSRLGESINRIIGCKATMTSSTTQEDNNMVPIGKIIVHFFDVVSHM